MKVDAIKDGKGNIIITEDSFEMLLACLDNQKFVGENPQNGDSLSEGKDGYFRGQKDIQDTIDFYNSECRKILHQKYVVGGLGLTKNGYHLTKKYEYQDGFTFWYLNDIDIVYGVFKDNEFKLPYVIERPYNSDGSVLTISEDGINIRPWTQEEIIAIQNALNKK